MLVYTAGNGVHGFTLDPSIGALRSQPRQHADAALRQVLLVQRSQLRALPAAIPRLHRPPARASPNGTEYSSRYIGSLVADFHRTLLKGGVFLYPPTDSHPKGKLRLLYEANPLAFIAEQAGGMAIDGQQPILSIAASDIHDRTPLVLGSRQEVETFASLSPAALSFAPSVA